MTKNNNTVASKFYKKLLSMPHVFFRMTGVNMEDFQKIVNENRKNFQVIFWPRSRFSNSNE